MADSRFVTLGGPDLERVIHTAAREWRFVRGERVETSHPDGPILVIKKGFVSTVAIVPSRPRTLLSIHGPGDLAGEHILFSQPSEHHRVAMTGMSAGSAWRLRQDRFRQILDEHPKGWETLARHLHGRAAAAEERISLMADETAGRRLAVFLLQLLSDSPVSVPGGHAQRIPVPLSRTDLAGWIGVSRQTVERVLRGWVQRGMVRTGRRDIIVHDISGLEKLAGAPYQGW